MTTPIKVLLAAAAVIVLFVGGFAILGRPAGQVGGIAAPTPSPTPSGSPTPQPTPSPTFDAQGACGARLSTCRGQLPAGTYTSRAFEPALTYTVPDGWFNKFDAQMGYGLLPSTTENMASLNGGGYGVNTVGCATSPWPPRTARRSRAGRRPHGERHRHRAGGSSRGRRRHTGARRRRGPVGPVHRPPPRRRLGDDLSVQRRQAHRPACHGSTGGARERALLDDGRR
jgi:hypothetical protein